VPGCINSDPVKKLAHLDTWCACSRCASHRENVRYFFREGKWYPYNPIRYPDTKLPLYTKDKYSKTLSACNKFAQFHGVAGPGTLFVLCADCNGLCGFELLEHAESERTVFELLLTRWPEPPALVIYDNACNVHRFAMGREPNYFKFVKFILDKFHVAGHVKCSCAYDPFKHEIIVKPMNTSGCEQLNSRFVDKRKQLYKMGQGRYLWHVRLWLLLDHCAKHGVDV
jgi:hypothetical protein